MPNCIYKRTSSPAIKSLAWKAVKIIWGIPCFLLFIYRFVAIYRELMRPWYYEGIFWYSAIVSFWPVIGIAFCLLQNKFQNLKWGIIIHLILTLLFLVYAYTNNLFLLFLIFL